jgi:glycosyltransferase involved in cell wall biosynthesis
LWVGGGDVDGLSARLDPSTRARHRFLGHQQDVRSAYQAMDVLAVPSVAMESFSRVSIEAQATGVPVLGSRLGGIPETMHEGGTGLLLPPGDVPRWRDAILRIARMEPLQRRALGAAGARFVAEHFRAGVISRRFVAILENGAPGS